jgi:hypothetical protein
MTDVVDFAIGSRCRLNSLGIARSPRSKTRSGTIIGKGRSANSIRVLFDGSNTPVPLHKKYIDLIAPPFDGNAATLKRPRDIADRLIEQRDLRSPDNDLLRETVRLPLNAARLKARRILDECQQDGYVTVVENWRQLPDGQIEFTVLRLPAAK